ncbi:PH domain-containing [Lecanosticta acicola]|uniref:PH domain-containing n=1 Tax=Lecanosticta acicola TaxID=111012 RepID=A0AAI8YRM6_9PEZI|nr:PH domain-containing [Lecanosticta acicola]
MGFRTLAFTYIFGGLTFLPLLLAAVLAVAWYLLPRSDTIKTESRDDLKDVDPEELAKETTKNESIRKEGVGEAAANGTFAVLRHYDFQAAVAALNARNNGNATGNSSGPSLDGVAAGDGGPTGSSESVYQSMYRSVFVGNKNTGSSSLLDPNDPQLGSPGRRKPVPAHIMYIVLRHGHLMLYDSPAQVEVKHVISLAHHKVTLQAGKHGADELDERQIMESDLFIRRTAIVLTPVELPNGTLQQSNTPKPPRPFYLFAASTIEKEDFYHALLSSRDKPPIALPIDSDALIKLQSTLHSSSLTPETRALNALLGRVFLGIHKTDVLINFIRGKIEKKLARIQKPTFIPVLQIRSLDLGDAGPVLSNLKMRDLNISGDMTLSADLRYNGGLSITLLAVAKLDLGQRFKTRTIDLALKATLQRIQGQMLLRIKPPPSNRSWFTFETMPELELRVEPVVSERKITYGFVLRAIEERVRSAFAEGLVKPNWDDVPMPFQDTRGCHARGGTWSDQGEEDHPELRRPDSSRILADRNGKTLSTPDLGSEQDTAISSGLASSSEVNIAKLRHASTMPVNARTLARPPESTSSSSTAIEANTDRISSSTRPPKPLRSSSIASPSPIVGMDEQTVEPVRADDESLRPSTTQRTLWLGRSGMPKPPTQKAALEELKDIRDRAEQQSTSPSTFAAEDMEPRSRSKLGDANADAASLSNDQQSDRTGSTISNPPRTFSTRGMDSGQSTSPSTSSSASVSKSQQPQQRKTTILAAAGAATNAARTWGWNTYQKNKAAYQQRQAKQNQVPSEPMGRGQPLPPPGVPLPGPQKGLWGGVGSMGRKPSGAPALPARRLDKAAAADVPSIEGNASSEVRHKTHIPHDGRDVEDEFGTWQENPGAGDGNAQIPDASSGDYAYQDQVQEDLLDVGADDEKAAGQEQAPAQERRKLPPPLPARRRENAQTQQSQTTASEREQTFAHGSSADSSAEDVSNAPALRVPEAEVNAIAAENSTDELAHGMMDDTTHVNDIDAVKTELHSETDKSSEGSGGWKAKSQQADSGERLGLDRTNTEERFMRGEDVTEEDFERDQAKADLGHGEGVMADPEALTSITSTDNQNTSPEGDLVTQRIRAQVQKHSQASRSPPKNWHGAPQGTAVDSEDK